MSHFSDFDDRERQPGRLSGPFGRPKARPNGIRRSYWRGALEALKKELEPLLDRETSPGEEVYDLIDKVAEE